MSDENVAMPPEGEPFAGGEIPAEAPAEDPPLGDAGGFEQPPNDGSAEPFQDAALLDAGELPPMDAPMDGGALLDAGDLPPAENPPAFDDQGALAEQPLMDAAALQYDEQGMPLGEQPLGDQPYDQQPMDQQQPAMDPPPMEQQYDEAGNPIMAQEQQPIDQPHYGEQGASDQQHMDQQNFGHDQAAQDQYGNFGGDAAGGNMYGGAAADANAYGADANAYGADAHGYNAPKEPSFSGGNAAGAGSYGADASYDPNSYGAHDQHYDASAGAGYGAPSAPPPAPGPDIDALLAAEREKHELELKMETKAREELEDMILRIEKHFKAEQAARKKAEELLQQAIGAELDSKNQLEDVMKKRAQEQKLLEEERNAIKRERQALENMRLEFENELQAARAEVGKAQEALAGSEERIRSAEQVERARLESEYQQKLMALQMELERMREDMGYRTIMMNEEMERWRQQASLTANAVMEAKSEVLERKRELDSTKDKMDKLLDKLLVGRERGIELSGAIANNQRMMSFMPMAGMNGMGSFGPMGGMGNQGMFSRGVMSAGHYGGPMKLPPIKGAASPQMMGGGMMGGGMMGGGGMMMPGMMMGGGGSFGRYDSPPPLGVGDAQQQQDYQQRAASADAATRGYPAGSRAADVSPPRGADYSHVQSKFRQDAEEKSMAGKDKVRSKSGRPKAKKPDRFEEANRDNNRVAAMAARWN